MELDASQRAYYRLKVGTRGSFIITVHGPADHTHSSCFLDRLVGANCAMTILPMIIGGGYNMTGKESDKSNGVAVWRTEG
jgi:hypothetical protein